MPISELVFGALNQNWSSLEPSPEFAAIAGTPRIENGGTFAVDFAGGPVVTRARCAQVGDCGCEFSHVVQANRAFCVS